MSQHRPRYQVRPREIPCPDGTPTRFSEVHEIVMVEGVKKRHRNMDEAFKTEEEAIAWIEEQTAKRC